METIKTLASLARFVIADVTNAPTLTCRAVSAPSEMMLFAALHESACGTEQT
jgi:hypothetical protein